MNICIREAQTSDFDAIWEIFAAVVSAGETYPYEPQTTKEEAYRLWFELPQATCVVQEDSEILGTYYIKPNQPGLGSHVCNCGYMVAERARRRGIATQMCQHSQQMALEFGFKAMQFNLVVSTNKGAVKLWQKLGFQIVGTLPNAFNHQKLGYVDAFVMYQWLDP